MIELVRPLLDWATLPRHNIDADQVIIDGSEPTSVLFYLTAGNASGNDGVKYIAGDMLGLCEVLALDRYVTQIQAIKRCTLIAIRREVLEAALTRGGDLVLPISRSIAADITQRRLVGLGLR